MTGKGRFLIQGIAMILIVGTALGLAMASYNPATAANSGEEGTAPSEPAPGTIDYDYSGGTTNDRSGETSAGVVPWLGGLAAFLLGSSVTLGVLYARLTTDDVLEGLRKRIYEHIEHNPGDHLANITRTFGISSSSARHHLDVLEWSEMIVSHKAEKMRHYYPNRNGYRIYASGTGYKEVLAALRNPTAREMVRYLIGNERANQAAVAAALGLHASTVNWHAKRLIAAGIVARAREGKDIHYSLNAELDLQRALALIEGEAPALEGTAPALEGASS